MSCSSDEFNCVSPIFNNGIRKRNKELLFLLLNFQDGWRCDPKRLFVRNKILKVVSLFILPAVRRGSLGDAVAASLLVIPTGQI